MITIQFSQCMILNCDAASEEAMKWPVIPRLKLYETALTYDDETYTTYDELFILLAQKLHREGKIKCKLISVCHCENTQLPDRERIINLDEDGDMLEDPHHGFFPQRLPLLQ